MLLLKATANKLYDSIIINYIVKSLKKNVLYENN